MPEEEHTMAFLLTHFWPGATEDQYRTTIAAVHPAGGLPEGQTYHAAGPTEGGYLIAAIWDSKESADRFVNDVLLASLPVEGGFEGQPEERVAEISNLQTQ
jgi:hypothetical protein